MDPHSPDRFTRTHPPADPGEIASPAPGKSIPPSRDHQQSMLLTALVGGAVLLAVARQLFEAIHAHHLSPAPIVLSCVFGLLAWSLRAATAPAAALGAAICLVFVHVQGTPAETLHSPGLHALLALFALTFLATRFRRAAKARHGLAEARHGRRAAQILANLGAAALFVTAGHLVAALAGLAEATADTVASEIGQVLGGPTVLLTTGRSVPPGTDGGISLHGTLAGCLAALAIAALSLRQPGTALLILLSGCFGLAVDSLLGATLERRGWIGNDVVNLLSTIAAGLAAHLLPRLIPIF